MNSLTNIELAGCYLIIFFQTINLVMAYRVVRLRREARRSAKLEDIFQEHDNLEGKITLEQLTNIYRIYKVSKMFGNYYCVSSMK